MASIKQIYKRAVTLLQEADCPCHDGINKRCIDGQLHKLTMQGFVSLDRDCKWCNDTNELIEWVNNEN